MFRQISRLSRSLIIAMGLLAILVIGLTVVAADPLVHSDKRINQVADFGGDALYCMDAANNPTNDTATFEYFRLLNVNGVELWRLSRADVEKGLGSIGYGWPPVLLGTGQGSYGEVNLYANAAEDGTPYFIYTGFDEYGKPNIISFYGCTTVGSAISEATETLVP
ncbi:MAG: hypothetical protein GC204_03400 [Chloroflexi bacterium]|nr:hypothetical protein [Chloroflexota bacterium]